MATAAIPPSIGVNPMHANFQPADYDAGPEDVAATQNAAGNGIARKDVLSHVIIGDILRAYGRDIGRLRPDHVMVVVADSAYRESTSAQYNAPFYVISVMESVSNEVACHWGCKLMTEDAGKVYMVHAQRPLDKKFWVECEVLGCTCPADPIKFSDSLRETGCRKTRIFSGMDKWSLRTGIHAFTHTANLKKLDDAKPSVALAKIKQAWQSRPICTSTVIRTWQRYLVSLGTSDAATMELIRAYCPLASDRAMPAEMMKTLRGTGEWHDIFTLAEERTARSKRWSGRALLLEALRLCQEI